MSKHANSWRVALAVMACLGLAFSMTAVAQQPAPAPQAATPQAGAKPDEAKKPDAPKPGEDKPFDEVVKDMEVSKGLFTFYYKADENKLLMEIQPEQLDKPFLGAFTFDNGTGERGFYASMVGGDGPLVFRRIGKSVQFVLKNTAFIAERGTPSARFTKKSFTDAILGAAKIQAKPHPDRKSILIDPAEIFVTDLPGLGPALNQSYQPSNYRFDKANSAISAVKAFPENVLLEVWLHFVTDNPRSVTATLPDARSIPLAVKFELSALKETGFQPRRTDDRVGHFSTIQQDFTSDRPQSPYVRYVNRWHLEKADPGAKLSSPKQPIVFWLENTIPVEYRESVKEGVLVWNKAFEKIGFQDAIVVKQQPDDADWDPADTRYSTIRWFTGVDAGFAIGPSRTNPYTGQIYDADIGFSANITASFRREAEEVVGPSSFTAENPETPALLPPNAWGRNPRFLCTYANEMIQQAAFGLDVLMVREALTPEVEERFMREYLVSITAHEVGHTLGLRHNFRASTILSTSDLFDTNKTNQYSQSSSVMDYNPAVIAAKGQKQGHFMPLTPGPYDYWAIEYAYKPIEGSEKAELAKIASRVADPWLPYSTDEDARGTVSPLSIDPLANQFDQSSDPLAYFRQRLTLVNEVWANMETKLTRPGEPYHVLRRVANRGLGQYTNALLTSSKFIGGIYHYRDHAGDPGGRTPYVPVPAAKQREALEFLRTHAFSEKSFPLPASAMNKLAIERQWTLDWWNYFNTLRLDYPWHAQVLARQAAVLSRLYHPVTLARIQDNELRFAANEKPFTMADMFKGLDAAIWSELDAPSVKISSLRRNLQREQLRQLIRILMRTAPPTPPPSPVGIVIPASPIPRPPEDATTLARASLVSMQARARQALASGRVTDPTTKAHLDETQARIDAALKAQMDKPLE